MAKSIYSEDQKKLVKKIYEARINSGLSQIQAATKLGKSQSYISKLESGQLSIDIVELKALSKVYKVDAEDLIK